MNRTASALLVLCLALAVAIVPSAAAKKKSGFKTGTYKATGDVAFKFKVYKGTCYASGGKKKTGYCFKGFQSPPKVTVDCPDVKDGVKDHEAFLFIPDQKFIPKSGKFTIKSRNTHREGEWDDHYFKITLKKNGRATGEGSITSTVKSLKVQSTCPSGVKKWSAKK